MGVPGLTRAIHGKFLKKLDNSLVKGADILVDGPNLAFHLESQLDPFAVEAPYENYVNLLDQFVDAILSLEPASITLYYDGGCPEDKVPVRMERARARLNGEPRRAYHSVPFSYSYFSRFRGDEVQVKLVPGEAEDAIISDIMRADSERHASDDGSGKKLNAKLILSSDSDFFRYTGLPQKFDVHVLPLWRCTFKPPRLYSVRMGPGVVKTVRRHLHMRSKVFDTACLYPEYQLDAVQGFLICILTHKSFLRTLPVYDEVQIMPPCWDAGRLFRSYAYTLLIRRHGTAKLKRLRTLKEVYRQGSEYKVGTIDIFLDETSNYDYKANLEPFLTNIDTVIAAVIHEVLHSLGPAYGLDSDCWVAKGIESHLRAVFGLERHPKRADIPQDYADDTKQIHAQILATLYSIMFLENVLQREILRDRPFVTCFVNTNANLLEYWMDSELKKCVKDNKKSDPTDTLKNTSQLVDALDGLVIAHK